jgi:hypothetical protein
LRAKRSNPELDCFVANAPRNDDAWTASNRQHVVVDFGHGVDAAQAHGRAELVADDIDRPHHPVHIRSWDLAH